MPSSGADAGDDSAASPCHGVPNIRHSPPTLRTITRSSLTTSTSSASIHSRPVVDFPAPDWPTKSLPRPPASMMPQAWSSTPRPRARRCATMTSSSGYSSASTAPSKTSARNSTRPTSAAPSKTPARNGTRPAVKSRWKSATLSGASPSIAELQSMRKRPPSSVMDHTAPESKSGVPLGSGMTAARSMVSSMSAGPWWLSMTKRAAGSPARGTSEGSAEETEIVIPAIRRSIYEPRVLQKPPLRQPMALGPLPPAVLQFPRTASSGRSGKRLICGFSYGLRACCSCLSSFPCIVILILAGRARGAAAAARRGRGQRRQRRGRRRGKRDTPALLQRLGGHAHELVPLSLGTVFAVAVRADVDVEGHGPQMRGLAQPIDRRLRVAVLELSVRRAHAAERAQRAVRALRRPRDRLAVHVAEELPPLGERSLDDVVAVEVREDADREVAVGIEGPRVHAAAAVVELERLAFDDGRRRVMDGQAPPLRDLDRILEIELDDFVRREAHRQRAGRAVDARVEHRVELELHAEVQGDLAHGRDFVLVDRHAHGFERQRELAVEQDLHAAHAAVVRAGDARQPLVRLARGAVERDLDREGPPLHEVVGDLLGDHRAVREERDDESFLFRVGVDVEEVAAREDLAAAVEEPQAPRLGDLVEEPVVVLGRHLAAARVGVAHRQVVVAVGAVERAAVRDLDRAVDRNAHGVHVHGLAELGVAAGLDLHVVRRGG